jgi:hypothetical protein
MTGNLNEFPIDPADTNLIFTGDPVSLGLVTAGFVSEASGNTAGDLAAGVPILGIFMGCRYVDNDGDYEFRNFWDGNSGRSNVIAHIAMPPHQMYHARLSAPGTPADVGTRRLINYAAGSPQYGDSRVTLGAADADGPYLIHRLAPLPNNAWTNPEPIVEVAPVVQQGTFSVAV